MCDLSTKRLQQHRAAPGWISFGTQKNQGVVLQPLNNRRVEGEAAKMPKVRHKTKKQKTKKKRHAVCVSISRVCAFSLLLDVSRFYAARSCSPSRTSSLTPRGRRHTIEGASNVAAESLTGEREIFPVCHKKKMHFYVVWVCPH